MFGRKDDPIKLAKIAAGGAAKDAKRTSADRAVQLAEEADVKRRKDRVGRYLKKHMDGIVFGEFSAGYLNKSNTAEIMKGVPVPMRKEDRESFAGGAGMKPAHLIDNMAWVMGIDPQFRYTENYVAFLLKLFNPKICDAILKKGRGLATKKSFDEACIYFRATLCIKPTYLHGMYSYARVCRAMYMESTNAEYIGRFKAEAMDYFELLTEIHPRFSQAYYYLGYAYMNMGLYTKTELTWKEFLRRSQHPKDKKEIRTRLQQIEEPVEIEQGCNAVLAGRYEEGLDTLRPFLKSRFKTWWPLSYYVGVCYARTGKPERALANFKRVLTMNGSHLETMEELAALYAKARDEENETKYRKKIELIRKEVDRTD